MKDQFAGCLLGGAAGDALGYTVEFMDQQQIQSWFGHSGITEPQPDSKSGKALISDDTQLTLFTLDGLIWAYEAGLPYAEGGLYPSYLRWLYTQTGWIADRALLSLQPHEKGGGILAQKELYFRRAPGTTCLNALRSGKMGTMAEPINGSKGCGGVMRVAPVGLFLNGDPAYAFRVAAEAAAITHGHPTGYLAAGALAAIIALLMNNVPLERTPAEAIRLLRRYQGYEETEAALESACELYGGTLPAEHAIRRLGLGWTAGEALSIGLYCAMKNGGFERPLALAVNHDGDSDSTGAVCGSLLGAEGKSALSAEWESKLELSAYIRGRAGELAAVRKKPAGKKK